MPFPYYERLCQFLKNDFVTHVSHKNTKNKRDIYCVLHTLDGKSHNIYKGVAKMSRLNAVLDLVDKKFGGQVLV